METCPKVSDRVDPGFLPPRDGWRTEGGRWNGFIGRILLVAGFIWAAWLDPWSLSQRDPAVLAGSPRMAARQAQAVVLGMAFLQLIVAGAVAGNARAWPQRGASWLTGLGTLLYTAGYALASAWSPSVWLIPAGALLNLGGFALLLAQLGRGGSPRIWRLVLPVICLGMLLDVVMGLFTVNPEQFLPAYLGPEDGVRLRMLRLARAAAIALPVVALFYEGLAARGPSSSAGAARPSRPLVRRGRHVGHSRPGRIHPCWREVLFTVAGPDHVCGRLRRCRAGASSRALPGGVGLAPHRDEYGRRPVYGPVRLRWAFARPGLLPRL